MELLGIDVGFSATSKSSGVAHFRGGRLAVGRAYATWESRLGVMLEQPRADVMAIDAPLLPVRRSKERRGCERVFTLGRFQRRCKPGLSHIPGTGQCLRKAGSDAADQLAAVTVSSDGVASFPRVRGGMNLVEAFPNAFLGGLLPADAYDQMPRLRRGAKSDWLYDQCRDRELFPRLLDAIGLGRFPELRQSVACNGDHDERAALICLLTAAAVAHGTYTAVGDSAGGYFFLPPFDSWAPWARRELVEQRRRQPVELWVDGERIGAEV